MPKHFVRFFGRKANISYFNIVTLTYASIPRTFIKTSSRISLSMAPKPNVYFHRARVELVSARLVRGSRGSRVGKSRHLSSWTVTAAAHGPSEAEFAADGPGVIQL